MTERRGHICLILGGARSGKTGRALTLAEGWLRRVYIATAEAHDDEMRERIARHRAERDATWTTVEAPLELPRAIADLTGPNSVAVVDCLTLWLANLMAAKRDIAVESERLIAVARAASAMVPIIFVSNEVGLGIVPENVLARRFRDAQGRLNQQIAALAGHVDLMVAGIPVAVKRP